MSKYCPIIEKKTTYLTCMECEEKKCKDVKLPVFDTNKANKEGLNEQSGNS